jgi:hypothetical protein
MIETTTDVECQNKPMSLIEKQDRQRGIFCTGFCAACSVATLFLFIVFIQSFSKTIAIICFWFVAAGLLVFLAGYRNVMNTIKLINISENISELDIICIHGLISCISLPMGAIAIVDGHLFPKDLGMIVNNSVFETCCLITAIFVFLTRQRHLQFLQLILSCKKVFATSGLFFLFVSCVLGSVAAFGDISKQDKHGLMISFYVFLSLAGVFIAIGIEYVIEVAREHFCEES